MASRTREAPRKAAGQLTESSHHRQSLADAEQVAVGLALAMTAAPHLDRLTASENTWAEIAEQRTNIVKRVLSTIPKRDREILVSFYLLERSPEEICAQMGLTETQFRLLMSRAKARFAELAKTGLSRALKSPNASLPVRKTKKIKPLAGRVLPIAAHAVAVFGDEQKAAHWFATPLALLGGRSPEEVFDDKGGAEIIDRILTRIEHNIPS